MESRTMMKNGKQIALMAMALRSLQDNRRPNHRSRQSRTLQDRRKRPEINAERQTSQATTLGPAGPIAFPNPGRQNFFDAGGPILVFRPTAFRTLGVRACRTRPSLPGPSPLPCPHGLLSCNTRYTCYIRDLGPSNANRVGMARHPCCPSPASRRKGKGTQAMAVRAISRGAYASPHTVRCVLHGSAASAACTRAPLSGHGQSH